MHLDVSSRKSSVRRSRARADSDSGRSSRPLSDDPPDRASRVAAADANALLYFRHRLHNGIALAISDALALALAMLAAGWIRSLWIGGAEMIPAWSIYLVPVWWTGAALYKMLPGWGLGPVEELRRLTHLLVSLFALTIIGLFLSKQAEVTSRLTLSIAFGLSLALVPWLRLRAKRLLIRFGRWGIPVAVYGTGPTGARVLELIRQEQGLGYRPVAVFSENPEASGESFHRVPVVGTATEWMEDVPLAIVAMPHIDQEHLIALLDGPMRAYRSVLIIPDLLDVPSVWVRPRDLNGLLGLEITCNLANPLARAVKRALDLLLVCGTLPLWLPLGLVLALLVKLEDGGPVLFAQERIGLHGRRFHTWKFRTMVPDAEDLLEEHLENDEDLRDEWENGGKLRDDPRVTPLGRRLRRFSLDEIPQFVNVLVGDMSLVGPRPLPEYHFRSLSEQTRMLRIRARPGITGMWQVLGRSDSGSDGLERWDTYYIRNWSIWLDIVIMARTLRVVLKGTGAY